MPSNSYIFLPIRLASGTHGLNPQQDQALGTFGTFDNFVRDPVNTRSLRPQRPYEPAGELTREPFSASLDGVWTSCNAAQATNVPGSPKAATRALARLPPAFAIFRGIVR